MITMSIKTLRSGMSPGCIGWLVSEKSKNYRTAAGTGSSSSGVSMLG